jgi:putative transposase
VCRWFESPQGDQCKPLSDLSVIKAKWTYFYRAIDKFGKTLDFMLSEHRDAAAASAFFARTIENNGWPEKVVIDKSGANLAGLQNINWLLLL